MNNEIDEKYKISPYLIIFPLYVSMVGIGILFYQRTVIKHAGYNAWISVILAGISIHVLIWMIYKLLSTMEGAHDIAAINNKLFGKILGSLFNAAIALYFVFGAFVKFKVYIELIQVWLFPSMRFLYVSIVILLLVYYAVSGGIRTVTGISVWATMISCVSIVPQVMLAFPYLHPLNLLPLWNHSVSEVLLSSKDMAFNFLGFEILLLFYPFVKTPEKSQKWAHLILFLVSLLYLVILVMAFMFFTEEQLRHTIWPTLNMIGIFEVPLLQRLEYIAISLWFIKIVAGIAVYIWAACRGTKLAFRIRPRLFLALSLIAIAILCEVIRDHRTVEKLSEIYSQVGLYFIYVYIPFVFLGVLIRQWRVSRLRRTG
ncbi:GerAB/ArcD/ProY family transporter [Paenibacillus sp. JDR-2]|uniref:GerAB/ArcD/ProY family transporter n=1 Tax=Paenibacillus sp. (strain JDR-2) TaxID=324057 RepID=UPI000166A4E8|nr:GerAB/ArcD/ProY family transporter [Paenibacillus sp. JDR-2]ACT00375.1 spore germination protein [Paenibacillus sp. JDR-2]